MGSVSKGFLEALKKVLVADEEPMMNIAGLRGEGKWRLVIFPRRKHRPEAFFKEGAAKVLVSPGVIDMGGVLITPVEKDFEQLDAAAVESIYKEVSLEEKTVKKSHRCISIRAIVLSPVVSQPCRPLVSSFPDLGVLTCNSFGRLC